MGLMPQPKDKDWLNGWKNKTPIYAVYKRPTSNQGTHTDWKWSRSVMSDFATPWTAAYQAPLSMGFSRQEYWSGVPLPSPLVVLNSLNFCMSGKLFISPSILNEILAGYSNLGCRFFSFITLSMSCCSFLAWRVSIKRSAVILMGILFCVICCFSLAAF